jgi:hypothetical protein
MALAGTVRLAVRPGALGGRYFGLGEGASHLAQRFLMFFVVDHGEIASQLEAHALALRHLGRPAVSVHSLEEPRNRDAQYLRDFVQPPGRNAIQATFVLVRLLVRNPYHLRELLL